MSYRDKATFDQGGAILKGATPGAMAEPGSDLPIVRHLFAGAAISVYGGSLSTMQINGASVKPDEQQRESLSRVEGSIGLRSFF